MIVRVIDKPWEKIFFRREIFIEISAKWRNNYFNYTIANIVQNITVHFSRYKEL
jgi:hypothetical protein